MATINGPFDFKGRIGNMRCYYDPGTKKWILGKNGGFNKNQFETLGTLQAQRDNANDIGGRSKWGALLYESLSDVQHLMHMRCWGKIMSAGRIIQKQDSAGVKGFHKIEVGKDPQAITRIAFNEPNPLKSVIRDNYVIDFLPDKKTATLSFPGFVSAQDAWWVTKYLAVRLYLVIGQISDMAWNPENKKWEPVVVDLELHSQKAVSDWIYYNSLSHDVNLTVSLDEPAFSLPGTAVFVALGVEFALTESNGYPFALPHHGSMGIEKCFNN